MSLPFCCSSESVAEAKEVPTAVATAAPKFVFPVIPYTGANSVGRFCFSQVTTALLDIDKVMNVNVNKVNSVGDVHLELVAVLRLDIPSDAWFPSLYANETKQVLLVSRKDYTQADYEWFQEKKLLVDQAIAAREAFLEERGKRRF